MTTENAMPELPDTIFAIPQFIRDQAPELVALHDVLVTRLRMEAQHVTMNTVQQLLLERLASHYIFLRWKELHNGANGWMGFDHGRDFRDQHTFWLAMTQEFNKLIRASEALVDSEILNRVESAIDTLFDGMHEDVANPMRERWANALEAAGL